MEKSHSTTRTLIFGLLVCVLLVAPMPIRAAPATEPTAGCDGVVQIPLSECLALESLYNSTAGPQWFERAGWLVTTTPCSWYGVTCQGGHVTTLDLQDNNLTGNLPSQLADLTDLQRLLLLRNELAGAVPTSLGNLAQLQELDLSENELTGGIPTQLGNLTQLQRLRLSNNALTGAIPSQLAGMAALQILDLSTNQLTGQIPVGLGGLGNLEEMLLANNSLTGSVPSQLTGLSNLRRLVLARNQLTGSLPSQLGSMSALTYLILNNNQFEGAIPASLGNLTQLRFLDLGRNRLTGSIPSELANLSEIQQLWVISNALTGSIPEGLCALPNLPYGADFGFNALHSSSPCVTNLDPFWQETQTVAPADLAVTSLTGASLTLEWTPIQYSGDGGFYEISYRPAGGSFVVAGVTADKSAGEFALTGLTPGQSYELRVRTYTPAHNTAPAFQQNALWSVYTSVTAQTPSGQGYRMHLPLLKVR